MPYEAGSHVALTYAILNTPPERPSTFRPDLPPLLDEIVMKAIAKDPRRALPPGSTSAVMTARLHEPAADTTSPAPASDSEKFGKLRDMAFFRDFGEVELWEVVRVATWQSVDGGTVLMRENDQGDCFYILLDGEVEVSLMGKPLAVLKPGSCFGEILYFSDSVERRTTTVTTRGRIMVMQIKPARCASPPRRARSASTRPSCACWSSALCRRTASSRSARVLEGPKLR